jgi:hypothetical protein
MHVIAEGALTNVDVIWLCAEEPTSVTGQAWVCLQVDNQMHEKSKRYKSRSSKVTSVRTAPKSNVSRAMPARASTIQSN